MYRERDKITTTTIMHVRVVEMIRFERIEFDLPPPSS